MPIDYDKLMALKIPDVDVSYAAKDCILYALGLGLGHDPMNEDELAFVYEKNLKVLPTNAATIGYPGFWLRDLDSGVDWVKVVHGEQNMVLHRSLKSSGRVRSRTRVSEVVDKGAGKGAVVYSERTIHDQANGELIATIVQSAFCRGDGGFGGPRRESPVAHPIPERAPDLACDLVTRPESAAIYRLSGDPNPLHIEPAAAKAAGFERPILHGLATFGVAGHALLKSLCGYDPRKLTAIAGRFSSPVFPGETIRTEMWRDGKVVSFRARIAARDVTVINNGRAEVMA